MINYIERHKEFPDEIKASFWFLMSAFFQRGISFIVTPVFTRLMNTVEYGKFSVFYSWLNIASIIITLNLFYGVYVRGLVTYEKDKEGFSASMQSLMFVLVCLWSLIYVVFHSFFNRIFRLHTLEMVCMIIIIWTNGIYSFWAAEKRVLVDYKRLTIVSVCSSIATPLLQILFVLIMDDKAMARIYGILLINVLFYPLLFIKKLHDGKVFFSKKIWTYALRFNIPLVPHYLSQTVLSGMDRIMIDRMIGTGAAGIYSLAYSMALIMTVFNSALMQVIEPWLYRKIQANETKQIKKVAYPAFIAIGVVNLALIAFAPELVGVFAPAEYREAIWVIPPVTMSVFFMFAYTFFAVFEFYYKETYFITIATLIGAVLNVALNYFFIDLFGFLAAGYTTLFCYVIYAVLHYVFMDRLIKKNLNNEQVYSLPILICMAGVFVIMGFVMMACYDDVYIRYGIVIVAFVLSMVFRRRIIGLIMSIINLNNLGGNE